MGGTGATDRAIGGHGKITGVEGLEKIVEILGDGDVTDDGAFVLRKGQQEMGEGGGDGRRNWNH